MTDLSETELKKRYRGCLLGLASGDALGTTLEFMSPGSFEPIDDMRGGGAFRLKAGQWTDDTSMALCLAESLIECAEYNTEDQMRRYLKWWEAGHLSSTGECFDIGTTTRASLYRFKVSGDAYSGSDGERSHGNGSIMRLSPLPMFFAFDASQAIAKSGDSSRTTHAARDCVDACRYMAAILVGALKGSSRDELLSENYSAGSNAWSSLPLSPKVAAIAAGSFKTKEPPKIRGSGYVIDSLEAALWAFYKSSSFKEGALLAVNLGEDADTTGAVYGQIAGAFYGEDDIPESWRKQLSMRSTIETFAERLLQLALLSRN
ncbi:MAG: ADP-ribosylglycohydrolase family protein [Candidatus Obscuribacterales bacterium]|nr:ADP-ribosylglycohydrolase family protein [Candidatus Obscuribacterales bacterium]